jgi:hypothetical protein
MTITELSEFIRTFNIIPGNIYEIIITTIAKDGVLNSSPFGVKFTGMDNRMFLKAYEGTTTLKNLQATGICIINIVFDPLIFFKALKTHLMSKNDIISVIEREIEYSNPIHEQLCPIVGANGFIVAKVIEINDKTEPREIFLKSIKAVALNDRVAFCRARAALIEMMIYLSRMDASIRQDSRTSALAMLNEHLTIIKKTGCDSWINLGRTIVEIAEKIGNQE